jgi:hypothetical protein
MECYFSWWIPARTGGEKKRPVLMVACGAPIAKPGREEQFFFGKSAKNVKNQFTPKMF